MKKKTPEQLAADFAARAPIGTAVRYFPVKGRPDFVESKVRSEPWILARQFVVVALEDMSGGKSIEHIEVVT